MKILIYLNSKKKISNNNNGGIESLNYYLLKFLKKKKINVKIKTCLPIKKSNKKFDAIISSNESNIFNFYKSQNNYLWLHNFLQIEKSLRKNQLFSIIKNKITCIFVSSFLKKKTSFIYNFSSNKVISNFLTFDFDKIILNYNKRKKNIIWSINRENELKKIIYFWINNFFKENKDYNLLIYGKVKQNFSKYELRSYKRFNIFFYGVVGKNILKKKYLKSKAMICLAKDETFCMNAIEGLSCGLPIICYSNTVFDEIIKNNYNGFKIKKIQDFSECLKKITKISDKNFLKINKNCYKGIEKYNSKNILSKWLNLLNNN